jgi:hypothetical protein
VAAVAAALVAVATAGCGVGPGDAEKGEATVRVTRDYGTELVAEATVEDPTESDNVIRVLDRETELTTRYGGGFVQSINGLAGGVEDGRSLDWFFYVNGVESPVGAADVPVHDGDRVWWDHHDWTDAMRVPAVVGSWPEPFADGSSEGAPPPARVECATERPTCDAARERLAEEGVEADVVPLAADAGDPDEPRMLVGPWSELRREAAAQLLQRGPALSGVFARFARAPQGDGWRVEALDERGRAVDVLDSPAGLVAALRPGEGQPTWLVVGTDDAGAEAAVEMLAADRLEDRYAVAGDGGDPIALPVVSGP